jgi:carbohydrate-selective porin OprB
MGFEYTSKELLPIKDMLIIRAGYLQPNREFLVQPLSKLFLNNMIESAKGIGANIKFSSSYTNWGTTIELKPHKDVYVKNGLFLSSFEQDETTNHGLAFEGYSRDTRRNGLWEMAEIGWTPKFTKDQLEGKYAFGGYYYETRNSWSGGGTQTKSGRREQFQYGCYVQADQMLYREASSDPTKLSKEGLNLFSMASFAPDYTLRSKTGTGQGANKFPFYFQTGLVYTGLLPSRDKDTTEIALGYAKWNNNPGVTTYTDTYVIEAGYTVKINGWWWARPFAQHIHNPAGNNSIQNASVVGLATGLTF